MKEIPVAAVARSKTGKGAARQARLAGNIPGIVYGPEIKPQSLTITEKEFRAAVKAAGGESAIYTLQVSGKENKVIIREMQRHPITSRVMHVDFHAISMNKPIHISLPIHFVGDPIGVKTDGGIMQTTMRELSIACLPKNIPEHFELDTTELRIGDSIHVRDLSIPDIEILNEPQRTVVVISAPTIAKTTAEEAEEAEAAEMEAGAEETPSEGEAAADKPAEESKEGEKK